MHCEICCGYGNLGVMPKLSYRKIYDDEGDEMREGDEVIVNGEHERIIFFDDRGEISLENWDMDQNMIFSIRKKGSTGGDRYDDIEDPTIDPVDLPTPSNRGRRADVV